MSDAQQADNDKIAKVLALVADGLSVRKACKSVGVSKDWVRNHADESQYARARRACADSHFEELGDVAARVLTGELDPQAARVAADIIKWRVARMRPDVYGDKVSLEHSGTVDIVTAINEARKRAQSGS